MTFKVGDTVRLKSGSPRMTVVQITDSGWCVCKYFDRDLREQTGSYPPDALGADSGGMRSVRVVRG
jgi:uncharacterized protein YodC (DUF2158 family)